MATPLHPAPTGTPPEARAGARPAGGGFLSRLGPGLITGAADDDPSGIATYSAAGAAFGYAPLWTALFSFPLMVAVQLMCSRLGMVSGVGLAACVRRRYPRWVLWTTASLLVVANLVNISADLGGMAEVTALLTGVGAVVWTLVYAFGLLVLLVAASYRRIARTFKWLTLALFAYLLAGFLSRPDWGQALRATFVPSIAWNREYLAMFVALLGTTVSPYLFFWQASQEVEEERAMGRTSVSKRRGASGQELRDSQQDVVSGMVVSNVIMYFIVLSAAATLHAHGHMHVETTEQAAEALRPLAGNAAYLLFSAGVIGTGLLGIPVLVGSCGYTIAEAAGWRSSLDSRPGLAPGFYAVIGAAMIGGLLLQLVGLNAVRMLVWSAIVNGLLAPPLILVVVLLTSNRSVMGSHVNPRWLRWLGWAAFGVMSTAALALLVTLI